VHLQRPLPALENRIHALCRPSIYERSLVRLENLPINVLGHGGGVSFTPSHPLTVRWYLVVLAAAFDAFSKQHTAASRRFLLLFYHRTGWHVA
jgi:hypothetical protein